MPYSVLHPILFLLNVLILGGDINLVPIGKNQRAQKVIFRKEWIIRPFISLLQMQKRTANGAGSVCRQRQSSSSQHVVGSRTKNTVGATNLNPTGDGSLISGKATFQSKMKRKMASTVHLPSEPFRRTVLACTTFLGMSGSGRAIGIDQTHIKN